MPDRLSEIGCDRTSNLAGKVSLQEKKKKRHTAKTDFQIPPFLLNSPPIANSHHGYVSKTTKEKDAGSKIGIFYVPIFQNAHAQNLLALLNPPFIFRLAPVA